jgi:hypothetical protein
MNKKQNELIKKYCLFKIYASHCANDTYIQAREEIYEELINISKVRLLEKAIRYDESQRHNPFNDV